VGNVGIMNSADSHNADVHEIPTTEGESYCSVQRSASDTAGQEEATNAINESPVSTQSLESDSKSFEEASGPTENAISGTGEIETPRPKARLRSCAKPLYPALLKIARAKNKDLELLFTILWSINAPPSLRALPRVARNLRKSLLILQLRYQIDLTAAGLGEWPEMLRWLASDLEVPDSRWLDFKWLSGETKASCRADLDKILDQLLMVLGACGAESIREAVSNLEAAIASARARIAENERRLLAAPQRESQGIIDGFLTTSHETVEEEIASDQERIESAKQQIAGLTAVFRERLAAIGVCLSSEETDTYLLPIEDDIVQMAAVITNVGRLSEQLQELVQRSQEAPEETLRYYGSYVLLILAVDRIEKHFVARVDGELLPSLGQIEQEARQYIAEAGAQIGRGGPVELLSANISSNKITISGCGMFADVLQSQRKDIAERNRETMILLDAAINTYKTAKAGVGLAMLIGKCQMDFSALRELRLSPLRVFQNIQLTGEMQRLAARATKREKQAASERRVAC
jgi:hypothetical protein